MGTKNTYNNYQFYEIPALTKYLEEQSIKGYSFCGAVGSFLDILKFRYDENKAPQSYCVLRKRFDKHIDEKIREMKNNKTDVIHENNTYIVFANNSEEDTELESILKKQNALQAVSIKKSVAFISILLIISVISVVLNLLWSQNTNLVLNSLNVGVCISLIINFLIYFIGDLHDYFSGKAVVIDGKLIFNNRTKLKDSLFRLGDVLKFSILLVSIFLSIKVVLQASDPAVTVNVLKMWSIFCIVGFASRIKFQKSYIALLYIEVFLITLGAI
ncbi:hypothetical protein GKF99_00885 [Finegoldia sp. BIOML-A2]|uniref:hypothetical protein n=1 Tax=unclassified Finegoldia TaxID=2619637 RepID=UPI0012B11FA4|nr:MULTISPECIES: hypothetical protein [unclassified Finegoldia]MSA96598.1 hypothetical protein [Finegoldia sp. BIOML-A5]MSA99982.1 hypothetical protein [Finegoldia sp. BIOML-A2]